MTSLSGVHFYHSIKWVFIKVTNDLQIVKFHVQCLVSLTVLPAFELIIPFSSKHFLHLDNKAPHSSDFHILLAAVPSHNLSNLWFWWSGIRFIFWVPCFLFSIFIHLVSSPHLTDINTIIYQWLSVLSLYPRRLLHSSKTYMASYLIDIFTSGSTWHLKLCQKWIIQYFP